jgi:hypothetical protein
MINKRSIAWYVMLAIIVLLAAIVPMSLNGNADTRSVLVAVIVALVVPAVLIWLLEKMGYPVGRVVSCPNCGTEMPLVRTPNSVRQGMFGGYTCPKCGTEMDAAGRKLA